MEAVRVWAQSVIMVSLLLTMMEMILPEHRVREAARTVGGMILLLVVVGPVLRLLGSSAFLPAASGRWAAATVDGLAGPATVAGAATAAADPGDDWREQAQAVQTAGLQAAWEWQTDRLAEEAAAWIREWSGRPASARWVNSGPRNAPGSGITSGKLLVVLERTGEAQLASTLPAGEAGPDSQRSTGGMTPAPEQLAAWQAELAARLGLLPDQVELREVNS
ncbi:MAG: stage III sporulation protein AF [Limnochordaceae bacterium]|nr:stage III sporulation protein AF [Limnochordaceae bacterium]